MIIEKLWNERVSYSKYDKTPISEYNLKKILEAADGVTPSLGNNYHYRVDVLPEILKKDMWPYMQTTNDWCLPETKAEFDANYASKTDSEWRDLGICFNWQFKAPLVLAYSMPKLPELHNHGSNSWDLPPGFSTGREATLIALGLSAWNVILTVEELGLKSCFLRAFNLDTMPNFRVESDLDKDMSDWRWDPVVFLCIGKGIEPKECHRLVKPMDIVNTLRYIK